MRLLLTGASGFLGRILLNLASGQADRQVCVLRSGFRPMIPGHDCEQVLMPTPLAPAELANRLAAFSPTHIIHTAALSSAELCEREPNVAHTCNVEVTQMLVEYASNNKVHLLTTSTDLVFDGGLAPPGGFTEEHPVSPVSVYSRTKQAAEQLTLSIPLAAVVRLSLMYGYSDSPSRGVLGWMGEAFSKRQPVRLFSDEYRTPIHVRDAAEAIFALSVRSMTGQFHCGGLERLSRIEFGFRIADALGFDPSLIQPISRLTQGGNPPRPEDVSLNSTKIREVLRRDPLPVEDSLRRYSLLS